MKNEKTRVGGVILAGGRSSRMQFAPKPLLRLGSMKLIDHIITCAGSQVFPLYINTNTHLDDFALCGLPLLTDQIGENAGPLAGIYTAIKVSRQENIPIDYVASFPGDAPWFPENLVDQLMQLLLSGDYEACYVQHEGQWHPLFALWSVTLESRLPAAIERGIVSPMAFLSTLRHARLQLDSLPLGSFENLNTPEDFARAERIFEQRNSASKTLQ